MSRTHNVETLPQWAQGLINDDIEHRIRVRDGLMAIRDWLGQRRHLLELGLDGGETAPVFLTKMMEHLDKLHMTADVGGSFGPTADDVAKLMEGDEA